MSEGSAPQTTGIADDRLSRALHRSLGVLTALVMFALMLVTLVDVLARYLVNAPIPGAYEITELLMGMLIFTALPVVTLGGRHVTIDLLDNVTPGPVARVRNLLVTLVSIAVLAALAWQMWKLGGSMSEYGDVTEYLRIPIFPFIYVISVLSGLSSALLSIVLVRDVIAIAGGGARRMER